jgi:two-component system, NarL family, invasion response regulator UvrY
VESLSSKAVGVITVDDQWAFLDVAREVIEATPGFQFLGEASSGEEAVEVVQDLRPDLVLVDLRMPGMNEMETARRITEACPESVVVLISVDDPSRMPSDAPSSGAVALVRKQDFGPTMLRGLWAEHGRPSP